MRGLKKLPMSLVAHGLSLWAPGLAMSLGSWGVHRNHHALEVFLSYYSKAICS